MTEWLLRIVKTCIRIVLILEDCEVTQFFFIGNRHELGSRLDQFHSLVGVVKAGRWVVVGHKLVLGSKVSLVLDVGAEGLEPLGRARALMSCLLDALDLSVFSERDHLRLFLRCFRSA